MSHAGSTDSHKIAYDPGKLLVRFSRYIRTNAEEESILQQGFSWLRSHLMAASIPCLFDVDLVGSLSRNLKLSVRTDERADVDCALVADSNEFLARYGGTDEGRDSWMRDVRDAIEASPMSEIGELDFQPPFMSFRVAEAFTAFDLILTFHQRDHTGPRGDYLIVGHAKSWQERDLVAKLGGIVIKPGRKPGSKPEDQARPDGKYKFYYLAKLRDPDLLEFLDRSWGDFWRFLVLIWKYWRMKYAIDVPSYAIEKRVVDALIDPASFAARMGLRPGEEMSYLEATATFFSHADLYGGDVFDHFPHFKILQDAIIEANIAQRAGEIIEANRCLQRVFELHKVVDPKFIVD